MCSNPCESELLNSIVNNKLNAIQCCASQRLTHSNLMIQELYAGNEQITCPVLMHHSTVQEIKYYKVGKQCFAFVYLFRAHIHIFLWGAFPMGCEGEGALSKGPFQPQPQRAF